VTEQVSRKHHFLSRCYLARFTDTGTEDGRLCAFDLIENRFFQQKPKNVAYELDFNRVDIAGHPPDIMETHFGKLEGETASVIRRICRDGRIPGNEEFSYVLNLITLFAVRNPGMRRSMTLARQQMNRVIVDMLASDEGLYESHLRRARGAGFVSGPDVPFEKMRDLARDYEPGGISSQEHLQTELGAFEKLLPSVAERYWSLLVAAPDAPDFITCDHPVSLIYKQVLFPIDPRYAVMGVRDDPAPATLTLNKAGVAEVNARTLRIAGRQLYSRSLEVTLLQDGEIFEGPLDKIHCSRV
jgi:hypothetical protein